MIRAATMNDVPALIEMGRAFFDESGFGAETAFDPESTKRTVEHLIGGGDGIVLVAERGGHVVGCAGAIAFPYYFNLATRAGQELFWWVHPDHRGSILGVRMLQRLEQWAKDAGCRTFTMIDISCLEGSPAARIYQRMGYRPSEQSHIKKVA